MDRRPLLVVPLLVFLSGHCTIDKTSVFRCAVVDVLVGSLYNRQTSVVGCAVVGVGSSRKGRL